MGRLTLEEIRRSSASVEATSAGTCVFAHLSHSSRSETEPVAAGSRSLATCLAD